MEYNVEDIVRAVRIALDQNMTSDALVALGDVDTLALEEIISSEMLPAIRTVVLAAPYGLLDAGVPFGDSIHWDNQHGIGSGYVRLPEDFLRLIAFKMSDWDRSAVEAITPDNPKYALQQSRYPGVRGCPQKPVVAIVNRPIGMVLEFFSCSGGEEVTIEQANYIPLPSSALGKVHIPSKLKDAVVYYTAYLVALSIQQTDLADKLLGISQSFIHNNI